MSSRQKTAESFLELVDLMGRLRAPDGCPWDRKQTHDSLKHYLLEESHELLDEIDERDPEGICGELGDLFLQLVFHAQIAAENGQFDVADALDHINTKLRHRHPHVFGGESAADAREVLTIWQRQKAKEDRPDGDGSLLSKVPKSLPALARAQEMTKECSKAGFDWPDAQGAIEKVFEEIEEIREIAGRENAAEETEEELGDLFLSLVNVCRLKGIDAEVALRKANGKFERRFRAVEVRAAAEGRDLGKMSLAEMDGIWDQVKDDEVAEA